MACEHTGYFMALQSVPVQVQGGALLVTPIICTECGDVEYRSPPIKHSDEEALMERMAELQAKQELEVPKPGRERLKRINDRSIQ